MLYTLPDDYKQFSCIAGNCEDTCCAGWQIVIDERSLARIKNVKNVNELDNKFSKVADIINDLTEKMERKNGKTDNFTTYSTDDIYNRLFGSANESPYYEEKINELAYNKEEFRTSIIKPLRQSGVMSDEMYQIINDLLQL